MTPEPDGDVLDYADKDLAPCVQGAAVVEDLGVSGASSCTLHTMLRLHVMPVIMSFILTHGILALMKGLIFLNLVSVFKCFATSLVLF